MSGEEKEGGGDRDEFHGTRYKIKKKKKIRGEQHEIKVR